MWQVAAVLAVVALGVLLGGFPSLYSLPHEMTVLVVPSPNVGQ
jgi:hypothetical protein